MNFKLVHDNSSAFWWWAVAVAVVDSNLRLDSEDTMALLVAAWMSEVAVAHIDLDLRTLQQQLRASVLANERTCLHTSTHIGNAYSRRSLSVSESVDCLVQMDRVELVLCLVSVATVVSSPSVSLMVGSLCLAAIAADFHCLPVVLAVGTSQAPDDKCLQEFPSSRRPQTCPTSVNGLTVVPSNRQR